MRLIVPRPREPHAWGRFVGFVGSRAVWEIEGQIYTDSVVVAGGGQPVPGFEYLFHFRCPDTRRGPMTIILPIPGGRRKEEEPELTLPGWLTTLQSSLRAGQAEFVALALADTFAEIASGTHQRGSVRVLGDFVYCVEGSFSSPNYVDTVAKIDKDGEEVATYSVGGGVADIMIVPGEEDSEGDYPDAAIYLAVWENGLVYQSGTFSWGIGTFGGLPVLRSSWADTNPPRRSRVIKLDRDLSHVWSSDWIDDRLAQPGPSIFTSGANIGLLMHFKDGEALRLGYQTFRPQSGDLEDSGLLDFPNPVIPALIDSNSNWDDLLSATPAPHASPGSGLLPTPLSRFQSTPVVVSSFIDARSFPCWQADVNERPFWTSRCHTLLQSGSNLIPGGIATPFVRCFDSETMAVNWTLDGWGEGSSVTSYTPIMVVGNNLLVASRTIDFSEVGWDDYHVATSGGETFLTPTAVTRLFVDLSTDRLLLVSLSSGAEVSSVRLTGEHLFRTHRIPGGSIFQDEVSENGDNDGFLGNFRPSISGNVTRQVIFRKSMGLFGVLRPEPLLTGNPWTWESVEEKQAGFEKPPLFNPFSAALSHDKQTLIFGPSWTAIFNALPGGEVTYQERDLVNGVDVPSNRASSYLVDVGLGDEYKLRERVWIYAKSATTLEHLWRHEITLLDSPTLLMVSNIVTTEDGRAIIHYRTRAGTTTRAFIRQILIEDGSLIEEVELSGTWGAGPARVPDNAGVFGRSQLAVGNTLNLVASRDSLIVNDLGSIRMIGEGPPTD